MGFGMYDMHGWWGMGGFGVLLWIVLILAIAALVKYLFFSGPPK